MPPCDVTRQDVWGRPWKFIYKALDISRPQLDSGMCSFTSGNIRIALEYPRVSSRLKD